MLKRRRKLILSLTAAAAATAVTIPLWAQGASTANPSGYLPDLVADSQSQPDGFVFARYIKPDGSSYDDDKLLLRFNGYVHNVGDGPVDLQGNPQPGSSGMHQYLSTAPASDLAGRTSTVTLNPAGWVKVTDHTPVVVFDHSDTHNHFHLQHAAEYGLWNDTKTAEVMPGSKVGFCLYDVKADNNFGLGPASGVYTDVAAGLNFCDQGQSGATSLREGISEGYMDEYSSDLDYQWIDVSNMAPGKYYVGWRTDPDNVIKEKDENNTWGYADTAVVVPGYRATPVTSSATFRQASVAVNLTSLQFNPNVQVGVPAESRPGPANYAGVGTLRYRIESVPTGGTLKNGGAVVTAGTVLPAGTSQLTYVPNSNFSGTDTFAFSAMNFQGAVPSKYPLAPAQATASINVGGSGLIVNVANVPGQMTVGTQAQFAVSGTGTSGGVTWTVNGVPGGNAGVGTVTAGGLYTAPATVPAGGKVTVQAVSNADIGAKSAPATISIVPAGGQQSIPQITGTLKKPGILNGNKHITISVSPPSAGHLVITLLHRGKTVGKCASDALAGQAVTCKINMAKNYDLATLKVRTQFTTASGTETHTMVVGTSAFSRVSTKRTHGRLAISVTPKRPGRLSVLVTKRGHVVARCSSRVLLGHSLTCVRRIGSGSVSVSVSLIDNQGRSVVLDRPV
ncbi:MAG: lysyl oxidase family protein [Thermoleophilia bacterium]